MWDLNNNDDRVTLSQTRVIQQICACVKIIITELTPNTQIISIIHKGKKLITFENFFLKTSNNKNVAELRSDNTRRKKGGKKDKYKITIKVDRKVVVRINYLSHNFRKKSK